MDHAHASEHKRIPPVESHKCWQQAAVCVKVNAEGVWEKESRREDTDKVYCIYHVCLLVDLTFCVCFTFLTRLEVIKFLSLLSLSPQQVSYCLAPSRYSMNFVE